MKKSIFLFISLFFLFCSHVNAQQASKRMRDILKAMHEQLINKPTMEEFENSKLAKMFEDKYVQNGIIVLKAEGMLRDGSFMSAYKDVLSCTFDEQQKLIMFTYKVGPTTTFYKYAKDAYAQAMQEMDYELVQGKYFVGKDGGRNQAYKHKDWKFSGMLTTNDDKRIMEFGVSRNPEAGDKKAQALYEKEYWEKEPILRELRRKFEEEKQRKIEKIANNLSVTRETLKKEIKGFVIDNHLLNGNDFRGSGEVRLELLMYVDTSGRRVIKVRDSIIDNELFKKSKIAMKLNVYNPCWDEASDYKLLSIAQEELMVNDLYRHGDGVFFEYGAWVPFSMKTYEMQIRKSKKGIRCGNIRIGGYTYAVNMLPDVVKVWLNTIIKKDGSYHVECTVAEDREMLWFQVKKNTWGNMVIVFNFRKE